MIEPWFRALKHNYLFLHQLNDFVTAKRLAEFYVREHNTTIPHSAFDGETPDEIYFGTGTHVRHELMAIRLKAKRTRIQRNRSVACGIWRECNCTARSTECSCSQHCYS